jgi:hypothetical protein
LPNNDNSSSPGSGQPGSGASQNTTSKHLESLQSVREALFSQDGWGGDNVKQDNAWDIDGKSKDSSTGPGETPQVKIKTTYNLVFIQTKWKKKKIPILC